MLLPIYKSYSRVYTVSFRIVTIQQVCENDTNDEIVI